MNILYVNNKSEIIPLSEELAFDAIVAQTDSSIEEIGDIYHALCDNFGDDIPKVLITDDPKSKFMHHITLSQNSENYTTDKLTGIHSKSFIHSKVDEEISRCLRFKRSFTLLLCDIDHFEQIRSTHDDGVVDVMLCQVVDILSEQKRNIDMLGHWGDSAFLLILPETDLTGANILAERIRKTIEIMPCDLQDPVTVSIGLALYNGSKVTTDVIKNAEVALQHAQDGGHNKVLAFSPLFHRY